MNVYSFPTSSPPRPEFVAAQNYAIASGLATAGIDPARVFGDNAPTEPPYPPSKASRKDMAAWTETVNAGWAAGVALLETVFAGVDQAARRDEQKAA